MGSKMSFGRGTSDQYTFSGVISVTPHPCSPICEPADCTQIPENQKSTENNLQSRWEDKVKATELTQPVFKSSLSGHDGHVNSESVCRVKCELSEPSMSSQVGTGTTSEMTLTSTCSSTTDNCEKPEGVHKRRGRPRKMKLWVTKEQTNSDTPGVVPLQHHQDSTTLPLATTLENHSSVGLPNAMGENSIGPPPQDKESDLLAVLDDRVEDSISLLPKRKRGRPKREEISALSKNVSTAPVASIPAALPHVNNISRSPRRLRSYEQFPPIQDKKTESPQEADLIDNELTSPVNENLLNDQGSKRKMHQWQVEQQLPAKLYKLDDSQDVMSLLSNNLAQSDKREPVKADKSESDTEAKGGQLSTQAGDGKDQINQVAILHKEQLPKPELEVTSSVGLNAVNMVNSSQTVEGTTNQSVKPDSGEVSQSKTSDSRQSPVGVELLLAEASSATPSNETPKSLDHPLDMTEENTEMEINNLNPESHLESPKSFQSSTNTSLKPEGSYVQRVTFRRKRGGMRKRRKGYVVSPEEENCDTEHIVDGEDVDNEAKLDANTKVVYVKRGSKTLLKCGYCDRTFKFMSQFIIHHRIHTGERPFKCKECGKGFTKNSNLNLHLKTHRKTNMYKKCQFCCIKFSSAEYASHMKAHAIDVIQDYEDSKPEKCSTEDNCEKDQKLKRATSPESRERKLCQYCGKVFQFQSALTRHVRVHTGEKPYKCDICGKAFGQAYFLRVHELTHWSVKRYNCTRCKKAFTHYSNAKNHTCKSPDDDGRLNRSILLKPALTYTCHICKNIFNSLQEFNRHMRTHMGAKLYRCLHCDKLFGAQSEFTAHQTQCKVEKKNVIPDEKEEKTMSLIKYTLPAFRGSTEHAPAFIRAEDIRKKQLKARRNKPPACTEKPFQSTIIPAHPLSYLVSKLNKLDTRSDPRKYLCPGCGRLFRHMGRLRAHMLTHARGQSYTCSCCGKMLANWKKLWHHQRIHRQSQGRFSCSQCGQGFRFVEPYKKHIRKHGKTPWVKVRARKVSLPYQCDQCKISFKTLDQLFSHQHNHSSTQDDSKDSGFDLLVDVTGMQQHKKMLNPSNNIATLHVEPEVKISLNTSAKYPDSTAQKFPRIISVRSHNLDLGDALKHLNKTPSIQIREPSLVRGDENTPITPLINVQRQAIQLTSSKSDGESSNSVSCAVCGNVFFAVSELYTHYLQHARGQV